MNATEGVERRKERVTFETDRHVVIGDVTLPPEGYQARFSDSLNRDDLDFLPLTDVEITSIMTGETNRRDFVAIGKAHVMLAFPTAPGSSR